MPAGSTPDQKALSLLGEQVRVRLARNPNVYKIPTDKAEIFAVGNFMRPDECQRMMAMIDECAKPSIAYDTDYASGFRTSFSGDVNPHDPFVKSLERRLHDLLGIDPSFGETIQGQRYDVGQEFQAHHDYFHTSQSYWKAEKDRGGQRSWTAMAYLNETIAGGSTDFYKLDLAIPPQPGALLIWNNMRSDGRPNPDTLHSGTKVVEGRKYIITKWFRSRKWS